MRRRCRPQQPWRVPIESRHEFLSMLAQVPDRPEMVLPDSFSYEEVVGVPTPRLELERPTALNQQISGNVAFAYGDHLAAHGDRGPIRRHVRSAYGDARPCDRDPRPAHGHAGSHAHAYHGAGADRADGRAGDRA